MTKKVQMETGEEQSSTRTDYKCTGCGAVDHDRGTYEQPPPALNCWKCGEGRGATLAEMQQRPVGMLPTTHPYWVTG